MAKNCLIISNRRGLASRREEALAETKGYFQSTFGIFTIGHVQIFLPQIIPLKVEIKHSPNVSSSFSLRSTNWLTRSDVNSRNSKSISSRIRQGCEPKPEKTAYRKLDERIKRLVDDYLNVDLGEYVKGVAANMSM